MTTKKTKVPGTKKAEVKKVPGTKKAEVKKPATKKAEVITEDKKSEVNMFSDHIAEEKNIVYREENNTPIKPTERGFNENKSITYREC